MTSDEFFHFILILTKLNVRFGNLFSCLCILFTVMKIDGNIK